MKLSVQNVLVVEDEHMQRIILSESLKKSGLNVINATNGAEGIESAKKNSPDVIIMDYMMPVMDGLTALSILKKDPKTKNIPIIIISANDIKPVGCTFVSKPVALPKILNIMSKIKKQSV